MRKLILVLFLPTIVWAKIQIKDNMVLPFEIKEKGLEAFLIDYANSFNKTIVLGDVLKKNEKINLKINKPVSLDEFQEILNTVIHSKGYAFIKDGSFIHLIFARDIRYYSSDFYTSDEYPRTDEYVLVYHKLRNMVASDITRNMRPFLSRYGRILDFNDGRSILIHDKGSNIEGLVALIDSLDNKESFENFIKNKKEEIKIEQQERIMNQNPPKKIEEKK